MIPTHHFILLDITILTRECPLSLSSFFLTSYSSIVHRKTTMSPPQKSYKDRTSPISRLEEREYTFFQRALFRFWTLAYIANAGNTRSREGQVRWSDLSGSEQLGFCRDLPRDEIAQLCEVHVLVYRLAKWRTGGMEFN